MPFTDAQIEHYKAKGYVAGSHAPCLAEAIPRVDLLKA